MRVRECEPFLRSTKRREFSRAKEEKEEGRGGERDEREICDFVARVDLPGLTGVAVDAGVVPKAKEGAGAEVDAPKPLPNDMSIPS